MQLQHVQEAASITPQPCNLRLHEIFVQKSGEVNLWFGIRLLSFIQHINILNVEKNMLLNR